MIFKDRTHPAVILLQADDDLTAPVGQLTSLLAQEITGTYQDKSLLIQVVDASDTAHPVGVQPGAGRLDRLWLRAPADATLAAEAIRAELNELAISFVYTYIFLDLSRRAADFTRFAVGYLGNMVVGPIGQRLVYLTTRRQQPALPAPWIPLRTEILTSPPVGAATLGGEMSVMMKSALHEGFRLSGNPLEEPGTEYPKTKQPDFCRIRVDMAAIGARPDPELSALPRGTRAAIARWARALTHRRVGLALGGSGSWGYAHVALMQRLCEEGIPIDLVAGASSGSLMGAYYCALGPAGLELAIARGKRFTLMAAGATLNTMAISLVVELDIGRVALHDLEVVFLPVATNLSTGEPEVIMDTTVGFGVRASSSFPGLFAPTLARGSVYADGALTDNIPFALTRRMGADMTIACNPLPPPPGVRIPPPKSALGALCLSFSPLHRIINFAVSFDLMLHSVDVAEFPDDAIVYDPPAEMLPLVRAFRFDDAQELIRKVRLEPKFKAVVDQSRDAWKLLSQPKLRPSAV